PPAPSGRDAASRFSSGRSSLNRRTPGRPSKYIRYSAAPLFQQTEILQLLRANFLHFIKSVLLVQRLHVVVPLVEAVAAVHEAQPHLLDILVAVVHERQRPVERARHRHAAVVIIENSLEFRGVLYRKNK